jgi:transcriptional regulator with XRE-family HTH domain
MRAPMRLPMQSYIPIREGGDGMISVKDIANACNVSVATVSKALNGYSDISEETKTMIRLLSLDTYLTWLRLHLRLTEPIT